MPRETHYTSEIKRMLEEKEKQKALAHTAHTSTAAHTKTTSTAKTAGTKAVHTEHIEAKKATATEAVSKHESVSKLSENKPSEAKSQPATDRHSSIANRFSNAKTPLGSYISAYLNSDKPKKAKPESKANSESSNASNAKTDAKKKESSLPEHGIITSSSRTKARNRYIGKSF